jgi:hypothetical protein
MPTVDLRRDPVVEGEGVPCEAAARRERCGDTLERLAPVAQVGR